jgi:iron only hydrogenase large subunit-like protein
MIADNLISQTEIRVDSAGAYYEVSTDRLSGTVPLEKAQVNLNDCLACRYVPQANATCVSSITYSLAAAV